MRAWHLRCTHLRPRLSQDSCSPEHCGLVLPSPASSVFGKQLSVSGTSGIKGIFLPQEVTAFYLQMSPVHLCNLR